MARTHARLLCAIWDDPAWIQLGMGPQWLYERLLSDKAMNHAGVIIGLTYRRWARSAKDITAADVEKYMQELATARFVVIDEDTEEVLVRALVRRDGIADQPNILKAALNDARQASGLAIRSALASELRRLPPKRPDTVRMNYPDPHAVAAEIDPEGGAGPFPGKPSEEASGKPFATASRDMADSNGSPRSANVSHGEQPTLDGRLPETHGETPRGRGRGRGEPHLPDNSSSKTNTPAPLGDAALMIGFDEFYDAFPRRKDRLKAEKAWRAARRRGVPVERLVEGSKRYAVETRFTEARFIAYPASWLNKGAYDNEPEPLRLVSGGNSGGYDGPWQNPPPEAYEGSI